MAKQVLSVGDFTIIVGLLNDRMYEIESQICHEFAEMDHEKLRKENPNASWWEYSRPTLADERVKKELDNHRVYNNLKHLNESLQSLNIEVETPDVEVCDE